MFACLATHGFGAQLLHGTAERRRRRRTAPPTAAHSPLVPTTATPPTAAQTVWNQVLDYIAQDTASTELATWLDGTLLLDVSETNAVIGTPNVVVRDYVQQNHASVLEVTLGAVLGRSIAVTLVVDGCP